MMTDSSGLAPFTLSFPIDVEGQVVTATATNSAGSTSEFSSCVTVLFNEGPGACCLSGGGCISTFEFACNGVYQGHGTTCDTVTCDGGVPAVSDRGMMLLAAALLALLTAGVISRRRSTDPSSRIPH